MKVEMDVLKVRVVSVDVKQNFKKKLISEQNV